MTSRIEPVFAHHSCNWNEFISASDNLSEWIGLNNRRLTTGEDFSKLAIKKKKYGFYVGTQVRAEFNCVVAKFVRSFFPFDYVSAEDVSTLPELMICDRSATHTCRPEVLTNLFFLGGGSMQT